MHQNPALAGRKRQLRTLCSDVFPVLGAHISGTEFHYPDNSWKEMTGMMANLVAKSGENKGQFSPLVEAICRDFRQHDMEEEKKYLECCNC